MFVQITSPTCCIFTEFTLEAHYIFMNSNYMFLQITSPTCRIFTSVTLEVFHFVMNCYHMGLQVTSSIRGIFTFLTLVSLFWIILLFHLRYFRLPCCYVDTRQVTHSHRGVCFGLEYSCPLKLVLADARRMRYYSPNLGY